MIAVLTGDIINSKKEKPSDWMPVLKKALNQYGREPVEWEIYRGDSFQLKVAVEDALLAAIHIKACIKQFRPLDIRVGIGLGELDYESERISESNGTAFIHSGDVFESLGKQTIKIKTGINELDEKFNYALSLVTLVMNNWTPISAQCIQAVIEHPEKTQKEIAALLNKSQSNISEILNRAGFDEIMKTLEYFKKDLNSIKNHV